jgi:hypothetical protein
MAQLKNSPATRYEMGPQLLKKAMVESSHWNASSAVVDIGPKLNTTIAEQITINN